MIGLPPRLALIWLKIHPSPHVLSAVNPTPSATNGDLALAAFDLVVVSNCPLIFCPQVDL